ncbi:MAG TPA: hypothetical protein VGY56_18295 [Verrucomicrobiae bacterium]|nr:hypothetical protein [Verrucomicrobiae bacterium]
MNSTFHLGAPQSNLTRPQAGEFGQPRFRRPPRWENVLAGLATATVVVWT